MACLPPESFENYRGSEDDPQAARDLRDFEDKGYLAGFSTLDEVRRYVGGEPIISRFAVLSKDSGGVTRRRLIIDLKQFDQKWNKKF